MATRKRSSTSTSGLSRSKKEPLPFCSLNSCSSPPLGESDDRVEVVSTPYKSRLISWGERGDGVFHKNCWEEILRNSRLRNPKRATMKMEAGEKAKIKETAKTAEYFDSFHAVQSKAREIVQLIQSSKHCIAFTGAGISTAAGIGKILCM